MTNVTQSHWNGFFVAVLVVGSLFVLATRVQAPQTAAVPAPASEMLAPAPLVEHPAPEFTLPGLGGAQVALSDFRGRVLLVNVWATWCPPCRAEMPTIQAAYEHYHDQGFAVVAVNLQEDSSAVATFMREHELTFPALLDADGRVSQSYQAVSLPSSFFVDRQGIIRAVYHGPIPRGVITGTVEQLLREEP